MNTSANTLGGKIKGMLASLFLAPQSPSIEPSLSRLNLMGMTVDLTSCTCHKEITLGRRSEVVEEIFWGLHGSRWKTADQLARQLGYSASYLRGYLPYLVEQGIIDAQPIKGRGRPLVYRSAAIH